MSVGNVRTFVSVSTNSLPARSAWFAEGPAPNAAGNHALQCNPAHPCSTASGSSPVNAPGKPCAGRQQSQPATLLTITLMSWFCLLKTPAASQPPTYGTALTAQAVVRAGPCEHIRDADNSRFIRSLISAVALIADR
jgi:hypothetical protein